MKYSFSIICIFLLINSICSCAVKKKIPQFAAIQKDTIVTFDPVTFEETIKVVESKEENISEQLYKVDTIITFNPDTYEETIQVVRTKISNKPQQKN